MKLPLNIRFFHIKMNPNLKVKWGLRFHTGGLGRVTGMRSYGGKIKEMPKKNPSPHEILSAAVVASSIITIEWVSG